MIKQMLEGPYVIMAKYAAAALAIVVFATYFYAKGYNRMSEKHQLFVAQIAVVSEQAKARNAVTNAKNKADKEKADENYKRNIAAFDATVKRLRAERPSAGRLPVAPPDSRRPDLACYDRPEYQRAYGILVEGVRRLGDEGSKSTIGLDAAKEWAK